MSRSILQLVYLGVGTAIVFSLIAFGVSSAQVRYGDVRAECVDDICTGSCWCADEPFRTCNGNPGFKCVCPAENSELLVDDLLIPSSKEQ